MASHLKQWLSANSVAHQLTQWSFIWTSHQGRDLFFFKLPDSQVDPASNGYQEIFGEEKQPTWYWPHHPQSFNCRRNMELATNTQYTSGKVLPFQLYYFLLSTEEHYIKGLQCQCLLHHGACVPFSGFVVVFPSNPNLFTMWWILGQQPVLISSIQPLS